MTKYFSLLIVMTWIFVSCHSAKDIKPHTNNDHTPVKHEFVESLLKKMTLDEKIGQMNQYNGFWNVTGPVPADGDAAMKYDNLKAGLVGSMLNVKGVEEVMKVQKIAVEETRLGIPLIFGFDVIHGYKTITPIPLAESASWDMEAIKISAQVAAREAAASGLNWTFAPMVDITRDARWGRVMEGAGEDPYLGSMIAKARIQGFQGNDLSDVNTIAACAKHFAGYGFAEGGRDYNTTVISGELLHNVILPPFRACVDAGAATFMNGFNELNGVPVNANAYIQRDLLKGEWGFEGMVVSDWGSISEMMAHGYAANGEDAAMKAITAGCDMDMESYLYLKHLKNLVTAGTIKEDLIDDAARRILNLKYELGLFEDPYKYCDANREKNELESPANKSAALDMAKKSIVLLKNENQTLPLQGKKSIAVIGPLVSDKNSPLGSWRLAGDDNTAISVEEALSQYTDQTWSFDPGVPFVTGPTNFVFETKINEKDTSGIASAVNLAKSVDQVVMVLGEHGFQSGEGRSRTRLDLPGVQQQLLEAVQGVNPNIILVVMSGRPLDLSWADAHLPAIVQAWQLGTESGHAIAEVLMGAYNPSGKLPMSFPRHVGQMPLYYNYKSTGRPTQPDNKELVFWTHYIDEDRSALYPFGHGLSYTTFSYSGLKATPIEGGFDVSITVTNTGKVAGEEVVQLYIRDLVASTTRPVQELKGFEKIMLNPSASKTIHFTLTPKELGFYDNDGQYHVEAGKFEIMVGGSSRDVQKVTVDLLK